MTKINTLKKWMQHLVYVSQIDACNDRQCRSWLKLASSSYLIRFNSTLYPRPSLYVEPKNDWKSENMEGVWSVVFLACGENVHILGHLFMRSSRGVVDRNLIYPEQLFEVRLEVKVIRNWTINCFVNKRNSYINQGS